MFAEGVDYQKGSIFGFGQSQTAETNQDVLRVSTVNSSTLHNLNQNAPVHNIGEERNVGMVNYEVSIRGTANLPSVSRKLVINKSADLLSKNSLSGYKSSAKMIDEIKIEWTERMRELQAKGFEKQDLLNLKKDSNKLKDLEFLKQQIPPGPFTKREEVESYMAIAEESKIKNDRLYIEVRYARNTCLSMSNTQKFFKLKQNGKKLKT